MASSSAPKIVVFVAGGTIVKGHAVKRGSSDSAVVECTANTDKVIGIAQVGASSGGSVEVAVPGGGGKAKLGEAVSSGNLLVPHTDGTLVMANASGDHLAAVAMEAGASGDIIDVECIAGHAAAAES